MTSGTINDDETFSFAATELWIVTTAIATFEVSVVAQFDGKKNMEREAIDINRIHDSSEWSMVIVHTILIIPLSYQSLRYCVSSQAQALVIS